MSESRIVRYTLDTLPPAEVDWARVDALTDKDIERAIADDPDAAPPLDDAWFRNAELVIPPTERQNWLRLDDDVAASFAGMGTDWRTRANAILRAHITRKDAAE